MSQLQGRTKRAKDFSQKILSAIADLNEKDSDATFHQILYKVDKDTYCNYASLRARVQYALSWLKRENLVELVETENKSVWKKV